MTEQPRRQIVVGITGASGAPYARRLVDCLCAADCDVHLIVTPNGKRLLADELEVHEITPRSLLGRETPRLNLHNYKDVGDVLGSGGFRIDAMIICPCSGNTLAAVAAGLAENLLDRAAAVTLKEARRLIVVPAKCP